MCLCTCATVMLGVCVCLCTCAPVCVCVCVRVCVHACVRACMHTCVCIPHGVVRAHADLFYSLHSSRKNKLGWMEAMAPGIPFFTMTVLYYIWCVCSPNDIANVHVRIFFLSIGIVFSNITVSLEQYYLPFNAYAYVCTYVHEYV